MNERLRNGWSRLNQIFSKYSPVQRRNLAIAVGATVLCLVVILWFVSRPNYVTVMSGLDNKSLGEVQAQLQTLKIPNEIQGSSVLVPSSQADTARVQLAMAGLPKSGYIGYSQISNSFGMTQDMLNIQVLDALQQSLDQTIQSIDGISSADVHIVMPQQQLFVSQADDSAKASVFVQLGNGVQLSGAQVSGIQQLVSHAVKGLSSSNVSVIDQNGVALSAQGGSNGLGLTDTSELSVRQQIEQQMTAQLTTGLNQLLGPGNSVVVVHANVSLDKVHSQAHIYQVAPGQTTGYPSSSQVIKKSSSTNSGGAVGGVAGQSSSNPGLSTYSSNTGTNGGATSNETDTTNNYDTSYVDTTTDSSPVKVQGVTVGVLVNSANKNVNAALVNQIKSFVSNAIGLTTGPAGQNGISVSAIPFQSTGGNFTPSSKGPNYAMWGGLAASAAIVIGGALYLRRRNKKQEIPEDIPMDVYEEEENPYDNVELSEDERMRLHLGTLAKQKPEEFANLLRSWLNRD